MDSCLLYHVIQDELFMFLTRWRQCWITPRTIGMDRLYSKWFTLKTSKKSASNFQPKNHKTLEEFWIWRLAPLRRKVISRRCVCAWARDVASFAAWRLAMWILKIWPSVIWIDWSNETHLDHRATVKILLSCIALAISKIGLQPVSVTTLLFWGFVWKWCHWKLRILIKIIISRYLNVFINLKFSTKINFLLWFKHIIFTPTPF